MLDLISIVGFVVLGVIGWITYKIFIWLYYVSPLRKIPGPPSDSPIFGNLKSLIKTDSFIKPQLQWVRKYGNIVKYNGLFNKPTLLVTDPKIIQEITLSKTYDFVKSFSTEMVPTFIRVSSILKGLIENEINQGNSNINLTPYISKTALDIIGLVGFSDEFNSLTSSNELATAYNSILNSSPSTLQIAITILSEYVPFIGDIPIGTNVKFKNTCAVISRISKKLVEEKYEEAENGVLKNKDLLSLLIITNKILPDEEKMTYKELKNQVL
ncbi:unnamed protein product [Rhizophagus irregularis]|nr:unnamed protein product [Rhizophagus irregularis]